MHTLCAGKPESDDRGNNMIAGPSGRNSMNTDEATLGKQEILLLLLLLSSEREREKTEFDY